MRTPRLTEQARPRAPRPALGGRAIPPLVFLAPIAILAAFIAVLTGCGGGAGSTAEQNRPKNLSLSFVWPEAGESRAVKVPQSARSVEVRVEGTQIGQNSYVETVNRDNTKPEKLVTPNEVKWTSRKTVDLNSIGGPLTFTKGGDAKLTLTFFSDFNGQGYTVAAVREKPVKIDTKGVITGVDGDPANKLVTFDPHKNVDIQTFQIGLRKPLRFTINAKDGDKDVELVYPASSVAPGQKPLADGSFTIDGAFTSEGAPVNAFNIEKKTESGFLTAEKDVALGKYLIKGNIDGEKFEKTVEVKGKVAVSQISSATFAGIDATDTVPILAGQSRQYNATVANLGNDSGAVNWRVSGAGVINAGVINETSGVYTAGADAGEVTLTATSVLEQFAPLGMSNVTGAGYVKVQIVKGANFQLSQSSSTIPASALNVVTQTLIPSTAQIAVNPIEITKGYVIPRGVTWSIVQGAGDTEGGTLSVGTFNPAKNVSEVIYTAPRRKGTFTLRATSKLFPNFVLDIPITIQADDIPVTIQ